MPAYGELVRHSGNEDLQRALELSLLACLRQQTLHVHVEGLRGTGKTTIIRAAAGLLPPIRRIRGCLYNCDPERPHCPLHRTLDPAARAGLGSEWVLAPFLEVSASARIGTVVGSIDLGRLTAPDRAEAALLPGTLARAHRGVVFVDEINRLADTSPELADALLDVMGTKPGRLQVEEPGLPPVVLTCHVTVWAASNPDEEPGPLADVRRQLADRFDLAVAMRRPAEPATVFAVLAGADVAEAGPAVRGGYRAVGGEGVPGPAGPVAPGQGRGATGPWPREADAAAGQAAALVSSMPQEDVPPQPPAESSPTTAGLRAALLAQAHAATPAVPDRLRMLLAQTYCECQLESLRAVLAWQAAAVLAALRAGRAAVTLADLGGVAPSVLRHRLDPDELAQLVQSLGRAAGGGQGPEPEASWPAGAVASSQEEAPRPVVARPTVLDERDTVDLGCALEAPRSARAARSPAGGGGGVVGGPGARHAAAAPQGPVPAHAGAAARTGGSRLARILGRVGRTFGRHLTPPAGERDAAPAAGAPASGPAAQDGPGTPAFRLADPSHLPPLAPRAPARFLAELPPAEMWSPASPAGTAASGAPAARGDLV